MRLVTCQDLARSLGVSRRETLPCPPISRTRGVIVRVVVFRIFGQLSVKQGLYYL